MAKEFELNLNLQLVGSVQFPGLRDLAYRCLQSVEQQRVSPQNSQASTPKNESKLPLPATENKRPGLAKTKSASSFLKNQTFAHKRNTSNPSLKSEASKSAAPNHAATTIGPAPIDAAKFAPKSDVPVDTRFFPPKSLFTNMPQSLLNHHMNTYAAQARLCREIIHRLVPRLESLHKNLAIKIKEIRLLLKNDSFANPTLIKEVSTTGAILSTFVEAVTRYLGPRPVHRKDSDTVADDAPSLNDPFLIKLRLDHQLKNQLVHENFVFASYVNLQNISRDLLNYVVKDLNGTTERLIRLAGAEAVYASSIDLAVYNLGVTLRDKLNSVDYEWNHFVAYNPNFLNVYEDVPNSPKREIRSMRDIVVPYASSIHSKCLRCGYMYKKQKLLKSYTSFFYLLTCNYLHEFKVDGPSPESGSTRKKTKGKIGGIVGPNDTPCNSYNLNDYSITVKNDKDYKFILTEVANPSHKASFKCQNAKDFADWSGELFDLLKFAGNHLRRFKFIEENLALREHTSSENSSTSSFTGANARKDMNLNLNNLLSHKMSLQKIQSPSLSGIFTPKVQSPEGGDATATVPNPFENTFSEIVPQGELRSSESPGSPLSGSMLPASRPMTPTTDDPSMLAHQNEHENYLKIQDEILKQQQQLMNLNVGHSLARPGMSRNSSTESIVSVMEGGNLDLSQFLRNNKDLMENSGHQMHDLESSYLVPQVTVLDHADD